jgi:hypothetical protein
MGADYTIVGRENDGIVIRECVHAGEVRSQCLFVRPACDPPYRFQRTNFGQRTLQGVPIWPSSRQTSIVLPKVEQPLCQLNRISEPYCHFTRTIFELLPGHYDIRSASVTVSGLEAQLWLVTNFGECTQCRSWSLVYGSRPQPQ